MKENVSTPIYSITPFTLLDYEHKSACILWFSGCNMRCMYCYNPEIVLGKGTISFEKALSFLHSRKNLLDAVVFSGGECLLHKNILELIIEVKKMGFLIKIDTNGSRPNVLKSIIERKLINYVALDFKATSTKFFSITKSKLYVSFEKTLDLLLYSKVPFEIRTTYHSHLLCMNDLKQMIHFLECKNYTGKYYIQYFRDNVNTLSKLEHSLKNIDYRKLSAQKISITIRE